MPSACVFMQNAVSLRLSICFFYQSGIPHFTSLHRIITPHPTPHHPSTPCVSTCVNICHVSIDSRTSPSFLSLPFPFIISTYTTRTLSLVLFYTLLTLYSTPSHPTPKLFSIFVSIVGVESVFYLCFEFVQASQPAIRLLLTAYPPPSHHPFPHTFF